MQELNDERTYFPKVERTPKELHTGASMTGMADQTFPKHDSGNTRPFEGADKAVSLEDWMANEHPGVRHPSDDTLPWMCKD